MKSIDELPVRKVHGSGLDQLRAMVAGRARVVLVDDRSPVLTLTELY